MVHLIAQAHVWLPMVGLGFTLVDLDAAKCKAVLDQAGALGYASWIVNNDGSIAVQTKPGEFTVAAPQSAG